MPFSPSDPDVVCAPIVWRMYAASKMWQDAARTTLCTASGQTCMAFQCTYSGIIWTAPTGKGATLTDNGDGHWYLNFNGNQYYSATTFSCGSSCSLYFRVKPDNNNMSALFDSAPGNGNVLRHFQDPFGNVNNWNYHPNNPDLSVPTVQLVWQKTSVQAIAGTNRQTKGYTDSVAYGPNTGSGNSATAWVTPTIGTINFGGNGYLLAKWSGSVFCNTNHNSTKVGEVETFLDDVPAPPYYLGDFDDTHTYSDDMDVSITSAQSFSDTLTRTDDMSGFTDTNAAIDELIRTDSMTRTLSHPDSFVSTLSRTDSFSVFIPRILADSLLQTDVMVGLLVTPMVPDTLTYTDVAALNIQVNVGTGDLRTVFDSISVGLFVQLHLTDTLVQSDSMVGFVSHNLSDTLDFTDSIVGVQAHPMYDTLTYADLMSFIHAGVLTWADALLLSDEFIVNQTQNRSWIDELNRTDQMRATRVRFGVFGDTLTWVDGMIRDRIFKTFTDTLNRTETLTVIKSAVGAGHDLMSFSDGFHVSLSSDVSLADTLTLNDDMYVYKSGSGIKIFGKFRSICLQSPEFNDFEANQSKLVVPRAMSGDFRTYIKRTPNDKLHWQFILQKPKKDELEQFIETEINNTLIIHDWRGRRWQVRLTTDSYDFTELARWAPGGNKFEVTLEFEGTRYYG